MTLPVPSGEGRGLHFRVLGFPVRVDPWFVVVLGFLGWTGTFRIDRLVAWIVIGAVSILVHELGHAVLARTTGARPVIDLYGMGGVTRYTPARPPSRLRSISISAAGPLVGIVIGGALMFAVPSGSLAPDSLGSYARDAAVFVNVGWGVLNLLPVLPLDGGHILVQVLPGSPARRVRWGAMVSVVVAAAAAVVALVRYGSVYGGVLAGWFAVSNLMLLREPQSARVAAPTEPSDSDRTALWLVDQGQFDQARHLLATAPQDRPHDIAVEGLVTALTGRARVGGEMVVRAFRDAPHSPLRVGCYARLLTYARDWGALQALLESPSGGLLPVDLVGWAHDVAFRAGAYEQAAGLVEPVLDRAGDRASRLAYNQACAWSRAGEPAQALSALERAVDLGWRDADTADADDDLSAVRRENGYAEVRARMVAAPSG